MVVIGSRGTTKSILNCVKWISLERVGASNMHVRIVRGVPVDSVVWLVFIRSFVLRSDE